LLLDSARRAGLTLNQLTNAAWAKLEVNKKRTWPKGVSAEDAVLHVKEEPEKGDRGLWCYDPTIRGGKYLVLRRDGTVFPEPNFVLGARDPASPATMRFYAQECERLGVGNELYRQQCDVLADHMDKARAQRGDGDAGKGPHRIDHPAVIRQMMNPDEQTLAPPILPAVA